MAALYVSSTRSRQGWHSGGPGGSFPEIRYIALEECTRIGVALSLSLLVVSSQTSNSDQFKQKKKKKKKSRSICLQVQLDSGP